MLLIVYAVSGLLAKLDHCVTHVSDWAVSNAFFRDVLGAELIDRGGGAWAYRFGTDQLNVHGPGTIGEPVARIPVPTEASWSSSPTGPETDSRKCRGPVLVGFRNVADPAVSDRLLLHQFVEPKRKSGRRPGTPSPCRWCVDPAALGGAAHTSASTRLLANREQSPEAGFWRGAVPTSA